MFGAVAATIWRKGSQSPGVASIRGKLLTEPIKEVNWPASITFLLPKMSLIEPAREKETEEAIDHPLMTQPTLLGSPRAVAIPNTIEEAMTKPQAMGATVDIPRN